MKVSRNNIIAISVIIILIFGVFPTIAKVNTFMELQEEAKVQRSQIEINLQRKIDLIPNLVEVIKAYTNHEEIIYSEITDARIVLAQYLSLGDMQGISSASASLEESLRKIVLIAESYPELGSSIQFITLQDELAGTENRIAYARRIYNEKAQAYNTEIQKFPNNVLAKICGYDPLPYFQQEGDSYTSYSLNFD